MASRAMQGDLFLKKNLLQTNKDVTSGSPPLVTEMLKGSGKSLSALVQEDPRTQLRIMKGWF